MKNPHMYDPECHRHDCKCRHVRGDNIKRLKDGSLYKDAILAELDVAEANDSDTIEINIGLLRVLLSSRTIEERARIRIDAVHYSSPRAMEAIKLPIPPILRNEHDAKKKTE